MSYSYHLKYHRNALLNIELQNMGYVFISREIS